MNSLFLASSDPEIESCFDAFKELRPHISRTAFLTQVRRQKSQGYQIVALKVDGVVPSAAGFRLAEFLAWGRVLYIDDLTTLEAHRGRGYAGQLLDWLLAHAKAQSCHAVHLDSGHGRHAAHRLYLNRGFRLASHHFALELAAGL